MRRRHEFVHVGQVNIAKPKRKIYGRLSTVERSKLFCKCYECHVGKFKGQVISDACVVHG